VAEKGGAAREVVLRGRLLLPWAPRMPSCTAVASGSWSGRCLSVAAYVTVTGPRDGRPHRRGCGIGLLGGQCLSLTDYVAMTEAHQRGADRRRASAGPL
jgi:hypothetical protein